MSIGERILELRKKRGLSQGDLASSLSISRQAVSKWESDKSSPDTLNLIRLSEILDTNVEYLATGRPAPIPLPPVSVNYIQQAPKVIEKVVEVPVERIVEVEKRIEVPMPVIQVVEKEKPVIKKVYRTKYRSNPYSLFLCGFICLLIGILIGFLLK